MRAAIEDWLDAQGQMLALWLPVLFGAGIGLYFAAPTEPPPWVPVLAAGAVPALVLVGLRAGLTGRAIAFGLAALVAGLGAAQHRAERVAAPVLSHAQTVAVEGRIVGLDRSASNLPRLTLDRVILYGHEPAVTPARVRLSVHEDTDPALLRPGSRVIATARLSPPSAPPEPGGFDFRRHAWFAGLGAIGYTRTPLLRAEGAVEHDLASRILTVRLWLSDRIQAGIPGPNGAFATAILTGDRSAIDPDDLVGLRASNLAHLLAISGLHMGLMTGFVFALIRYGLALIPALALTWPLKKVAALVALAAGAGYLVLSGATVATQRAFIMTAVVLVAVLLDRPALTLRSVAIAAAIVLAVRPESLIEAGFQMSFAATVALIAVYEALRHRSFWQARNPVIWRLVKPVLGVAITAFVAGMATAPFSAMHFNRLSQYGLLANVIAVPAMGLVVMPAAVIAGVLWPFGLNGLPLAAMDWGIGYILAVANGVAALEGATRPVPAARGFVPGVVALGGVWLILVRGRTRPLGAVPIAAALILWPAPRPPVLIAENGRLFGIATEAGRALNSARGQGFVAANWLDGDGDAADQAAAAARRPMRREGHRIIEPVAGMGVFVYFGTAAFDPRAPDACAEAAVVLAPAWERGPDGPCLFIGRAELTRHGAIGLYPGAAGPVLIGARSGGSVRPWSGGSGQAPHRSAN